jgi:hypothetical protein
MKTIFLVLFVLGLVVACSAQPVGNYEAFSDPVPGVVRYYSFLEKKSANPYVLTQGMDFRDKNGNGIAEVGDTIQPFSTSTTPVSTTQRLLNDGSEYRIGVVAENAAGYYSGMGVAIGLVGAVPAIPTNPGLRKK